MEILQPKLRFPEFKGNWELNTFNHFFKIGSSKRVLQEDWQTEGIPFFRTRELVKLANNEVIQNEIYIKYELFELLKKKYGVPQIGDLLISGVGTLGISYIVNNSKPFYFKDGNVIWFKKIQNINSQYFNYIFQNSFVQNQIFDNASITTVGTFTIDNANKTKFYFSNEIAEQTKIANFLSAVDEQLNLLKEKKALLENYKKGIMQKIFKQEIRFKDDNGNDFENWKEKSLGEVVEIVGGGTPETSKEEYWNGNINWFTPTEIKSDYVSKSLRTITEFGLKKSSAKLLPVGTILLTTRATIGEAAIALEPCTTNQGFQSIIVKKNINNIFLFNWIKENRSELMKRANGSTFPEISKSEIALIEIPVPCLKEQIKIANFLSAIDEKISLVSNQIQDTQEYKKGLLQQMFV